MDSRTDSKIEQRNDTISATDTAAMKTCMTPSNGKACVVNSWFAAKKSVNFQCRDVDATCCYGNSTWDLVAVATLIDRSRINWSVGEEYRLLA
jgi:hypothetical protein